MKSKRSILSFSLGIALAGAASLVPALAATDGGHDEITPATNRDCTFDTQRFVRPERRWRELTHAADLVTAGAATSRRHPTRPGEDAPPIPLRNFVDDEIFGTMAAASVKPTRLATDEEFIRRVTLDLTGDIPTSARVKSFLTDTRADKRDQLVDELLHSEAFVNRWTMWFGDIVQNVVVANNTRLYNTGRNAYYNWIRDAIRSGKPYDQLVRELVSGTGDSYLTGPPNYAVRQIQRNGPIQDTFDNLAAKSVEKFMAIPFECISCHSGPGHLDLVNSYLAAKQRKDFWETAAFF